MPDKVYTFRGIKFLEEDRQLELTIDGDKFVIKAVFPNDQKAVARMVSLQLGNQPRNSFSPEDLDLFEMDAFIDQCIVESPDWWTTSEECLDPDLRRMLYAEISKWTGTFNEGLKKNRPVRGGKETRQLHGRVSDPKSETTPDMGE